MYTNQCIQCQSNFEISRNSRRRRYCDSCKPTFIKHKVCKNCSNQFDTPNSKKRMNEFCSSSCSATYNNTRKNKKIYDTKCTYCNFIIPLNRKHTTTNKYCSKECNLLHKEDIRIEKFYVGELSSRTSKLILLKLHGNICLDPLCAWDFSKRKVNVELEHIDGNHNNNHPSNLIILCPSCHSLTSTYKAKNKGNGRASRLQRYHDGKSW